MKVSIKQFSIWLLMILVMSQVQANDARHETQQRLMLTGSSTVAPLMAEIAKRYESLHPEVRIDVQMGGSSRGINDIRQSTVDIGMVSRVLKSNEKDLIAYTVALDGIGLIVHASNPVLGLTQKQVVDIFTGKITNWQQVGGADLPITVVNKAQGRSTLELFLQHFELKNRDVKAQVVIGDNQQGIKTVAGNPGAIGYVSIGAAEFEIKQQTSIQLLLLNGESASVKAVAQGSYSLSRPLNLIVQKQPEGLVKQFIAYSMSAEVADLVAAQFFVVP